MHPLLLLLACADEPAPDTGAPVETPMWDVAASHPDAALIGITGTSENDVWAFGADDGSGGLVLRWDGAAWTRIANPDRHDLWWGQVFEDGTVHAVGEDGTILRGTRDGLARMPTPGLGGQTLYGTWGTGPDDSWVVGGYAGRAGFAWHFDGVAWTEEVLPDDLPRDANGEPPALFKVWGPMGRRGTSPSATPPPDGEAWIVGGNGTLLHRVDGAWRVVPTGTDALLFTVHGNGDTLAVVGAETVLVGTGEELADVTPLGAGLLQGVHVEEDGTVVVTGANATTWVRAPDGRWTERLGVADRQPESLHATWTSPEGGRWAVGGAVLSGALVDGLVVREGPLASVWSPPEPPATTIACPAEDVDPVPHGSIARRWNEQALEAIRRDIPRPGVHARNLYHLSVAMWDAWATYDDLADAMLSGTRIVLADPAARDAARETAISHAAYRVLSHRYPGLTQVGGPVTAACLDAFMGVLALDPTDTHVDGDDPVAVGNRIGAAVIATFADDGANEANDYADTTGFDPVNEPLVVDRPGAACTEPDEWQLLNLAKAETQNGLVLASGLQRYIGAQWGVVRPFALGDTRAGTWAPILLDEDAPGVHDAGAADWVLDVLRKHARLDPSLPETIDLSPGAYGNNPLGTDDGRGHAINPVTGAPYAPNVVRLGDFARVLAEFWADGPKSETPPGHWNVLANDVGDALEPDGLVLPVGAGAPVDRLTWDVHLYLALDGALHDAAIAAWGLKRETLGPRPITLIRWMAEQGQRSEPDAADYDPDGLPLEPGVVERITAESAAPGQRHHALRWYVGELAVKTWRGEPGDRANVTSGVGWVRAREWMPYQRRTFVTPAFPGFVSGHSTFSHAAAEVLSGFTGSPYFPGGLGTFVARAGAYLVFEDGPSADVQLQWATYADAADQAGQSRRWGGIHIAPDDFGGRRLGAQVGTLALDAALPWFEGTARMDGSGGP
ncbi:MAG: hypothetical protein RLZZ299_287 [Pseudomonadota bacterium]